MTKFKDYLNDIEKFRNMKVGLVKKPSEDTELIKRIKEDFEIGEDLFELAKELNSKLSKTYTGKFKFDFCLLEDINIERLKIKHNNDKEHIKEKFYKLADSLAKSQTEVERKIESLRNNKHSR